MKGNETIAGASYEHLIGGGEKAIMTRNVKVSSETTIERGALLAGGLDGSDVTVKLATASDASGKELYIAAEDAASVTTVTVYTRGRFNRNAIKLSDGLKIETFEGELRRQNIELTEEQ